MTGVKELKKGDYILHRGQPYRVVGKENVTVGTHMHQKVKLSVEGAFSGAKEVLTLASHENLQDVEFVRKVGQLISKQPLQVMDLVSYETLNAQADEEVASSLNEGDTVTFAEFQGKVIVLGKK